MSEATQAAKPDPVDEEVDEVTLGDKRVDIQTYDRYKGRKGVKDRLAILTPTLIRARVHYYREKKKTIRCHTTPAMAKEGKQAKCCEILGPIEQAFGLILFHYTTDADSSFIAGTENACAGRVKFWKISENRYSELTSIHKQFPLLGAKFEDPQHDFIADCTNEEFQRMAFTPCREAHWKKKADWWRVLTQLMEKGKPRLAKMMGIEMTHEELLAILEVDKGPVSNPAKAAGDINVDDILGDLTT